MPVGFIKKNFNKNSNNINQNTEYNKSNGSNKINYLSKLQRDKKNDLLKKINEKVIKEKIQTRSIKLNKEKEEKIKIDKNDESKSQSQPSNKSSSNSNDDGLSDVKIDENDKCDKKDSNDDEDDILSEQKDEMEMEEGGNNLLSINKVDSIKVHPSFSRHNYTGSGFSYNSNNSNSNKSSIKQKCNTEPNNPNLYMNGPPSGRSNNSSNFYYPGGYVGTYGYNNNYGGYAHTSNFVYHFKNSFLSTNTNSHNQSGQKFDSSYSSESGQSPHYLGNYQPMHNIMANFPCNNYYLPLRTNVTPISNPNKHLLPRNLYSNERLYSKELFSPNVNSKNESKFQKNFGSKKEKQVINLEDVASGKETRTTVMIRNIPIKYLTEDLEKELEAFEGKYDCLYMPYDYDNEGNKGYAFLNLTNPYHVLLFYDYFYSKSWMFYESKKICELNYANFQGIEEIKKHAKNYKSSKKPVFFICTKDDINNIIEIPIKYINILLKAHPKMKYHEMKNRSTIIVESFN